MRIIIIVLIGAIAAVGIVDYGFPRTHEDRPVVGPGPAFGDHYVADLCRRGIRHPLNPR
jgi:hypothetical protein